IVFLVDTLRRDHLSLYGYPVQTSPEIERVARNAIVFDAAWTPSSWTNPAVASLFTGEFPATHGIREHRSALAPEFVTLAEYLDARGYNTRGLVVNPGVRRGGFEQGFDKLEFLNGAKAEKVARAALERTSKDPFFLYIHVMDTHYPYRPAPRPF